VLKHLSRPVSKSTYRGGRMPEIEFLTVEHLSTKELARIFSKVAVNPITGCWEWTAALNTYGYGCIWYKGRQEVAHRLIYAWTVGPIPKGVAPDIPGLDHIVCDNPSCCNPVHLRPATTVENLRRTNSISAVNRRKTHCIYGHELTTYPNRSGGYGRTCKTCQKRTCHAAYLRRKARLSNP
jgi:hypothetical protein